MEAPRPEELLIKSILVGDGRLPLSENTVAGLVDSIREVGLLNPIIVFRAAGHMPTLVAGRHRLEACRRLKMKSIQCRVMNTDDKKVRTWAMLTEIDENLVRRNLSSSQRAMLIAKRKTLYETMHPATKHGATGRGRNRDAKSAPLSFAADTAAKTGKSKRLIEVDAQRGKTLGDDLGRVVGTSLDKGTELDALAQMIPEEREPIIAAAERGEKVSAKKRDVDVDAKEHSERVKCVVVHMAIRDLLAAIAEVAPDEVADDPRMKPDERHAMLEDLAIIQRWISQCSTSLAAPRTGRAPA